MPLHERGHKVLRTLQSTQAQAHWHGLALAHTHTHAANTDRNTQMLKPHIGQSAEQHEISLWGEFMPQLVYSQ